MSHGQGRNEDRNPIRYGDIFIVSGDLASKPIKPMDAAAMQTAEKMVFGHTQRDGPASAMQAAGMINERDSLVRSRELTDIIGNEGVSISETEEAGKRIIIESIGSQVLGQFVELDEQSNTPAGSEKRP